MSAEANKALIRRHTDLINRKDLEAALAQLDPSFVDHEMRPGMPTGIEGARYFFTMLLNAFPDMQANLDDLLAEGDRVVTRLTVRGTQSGPFLGLPASGKHASWTVIDVHRIVDGRLAEHWGLSDEVGLMQQLGFMPSSVPSN